MSTADIIMAVFGHWWDKKSAEEKNKSYANFSSELYAASTDGLHSLGTPTIAIVKSENSTATHFDVFLALDDRYGPTIMEIDEGRQNVYYCIICFLFFLYKADTTLLTVETKPIAEKMLKDIFQSRNNFGDDYLKGLFPAS